jgi:hypothetical protein
MFSDTFAHQIKTVDINACILIKHVYSVFICQDKSSGNSLLTKRANFTYNVINVQTQRKRLSIDMQHAG